MESAASQGFSYRSDYGLKRTTSTRAPNTYRNDPLTTIQCNSTGALREVADRLNRVAQTLELSATYGEEDSPTHVDFRSIVVADEALRRRQARRIHLGVPSTVHEGGSTNRDTVSYPSTAPRDRPQGDEVDDILGDGDPRFSFKSKSPSLDSFHSDGDSSVRSGGIHPHGSGGLAPQPTPGLPLQPHSDHSPNSSSSSSSSSAASSRSPLERQCSAFSCTSASSDARYHSPGAPHPLVPKLNLTEVKLPLPLRGKPLSNAAHSRVVTANNAAVRDQEFLAVVDTLNDITDDLASKSEAVKGKIEQLHNGKFVQITHRATVMQDELERSRRYIEKLEEQVTELDQCRIELEERKLADAVRQSSTSSPSPSSTVHSPLLSTDHCPASFASVWRSQVQIVRDRLHRQFSTTQCDPIDLLPLTTTNVEIGTSTIKPPELSVAAVVIAIDEPASTDKSSPPRFSLMKQTDVTIIDDKVALMVDGSAQTTADEASPRTAVDENKLTSPKAVPPQVDSIAIGVQIDAVNVRSVDGSTQTGPAKTNTELNRRSHLVTTTYVVQVLPQRRSKTGAHIRSRPQCMTLQPIMRRTHSLQRYECIWIEDLQATKPRARFSHPLRRTMPIDLSRHVGCGPPRDSPTSQRSIQVPHPKQTRNFLEDFFRNLMATCTNDSSQIR